MPQSKITGKLAPLERGEIDTLILQALICKLMAKGMLSPEDVKALLLDAAMHLGEPASSLTPEAARDIANEQLAPAFLGGS